MTKKDFIVVSGVIKNQLDAHYGLHEKRIAIVNVAIALAAQFASINPRFDHDKFYTACGIDSGKACYGECVDELLAIPHVH